ncbi:Transcriptional regulator KdgR [bacterium HR39]|nr:Transcriptional regulator KdgR [bacterium HR39]
MQSLEKTSRVLDLFTPERPEWSITEVARAIGIAKSSAFGLLNSLAEVGILQRSGRGRFRIGWRVASLARVLLDTEPVVRIASAHMDRLVRQYGETVHLATLQRGRVVYLDKREGTHAVRVAITNVGAELPPHGSGVGKVLLAHAPKHEVELVLERYGLPKLTERTITDRDTFLKELERVRALGYAYDLGETIDDLCCVAAPIFNHAGVNVAAISFSVPAYRFQRQQAAYRNVILETARRISVELLHEEEESRWRRHKSA